MTMSMVGPGLTTTSYKKRKQTKRTKNQQAAFELRHREYNKSMKRMNCHSQMMTLEEYDLYVRGKYKPKEKKGEFKELVPSPTFQRTQKHYPSAGNGIGVATKKESPTYSGERQLLGIATMHKSNMVPIFADNKEAAIEIARMRR
jgi:hypothetical protein